MSWSTLASPPEDANWRIEPKELAAALVSKWPSAMIQWEDDRRYSAAFRFEWDTKDYHVVGSFDLDGQTLVIERASEEDLAELMIWYRSLVPPDQPLVAASGSGRYCALTPQMTVSDFLREYR